MSYAIGGVNATRTTTASDGFTLGEKIAAGDGKEYVYIQASEALTANAAVLITEAGASEMVDNTSTASAFGDRVGVIEVAIASGSFGWAQVYGAGIVSVGTSAAANVQLNGTATAGRIDDDATAGSEDITGVALTAAESSNLAACYISYPTVGVTN